LNTVGNSNGNHFDFDKDNVTSDMLKNVIIVGTKVDMYSKKVVKFSEATELCKKLGLAGCVEASARVNATKYQD
jgi:hypothetical protein